MINIRKNREKAFYVYQFYARQARTEGRFVSALSFFQKALELDPKNTGLLCTLGELYEEVGETDHAVSMYHRVILLSGWGNSKKSREAREAIYRLTAGTTPLREEHTGREGHRI